MTVEIVSRSQLSGVATAHLKEAKIYNLNRVSQVLEGRIIMMLDNIILNI